MTITMITFHLHLHSPSLLPADLPGSSFQGTTAVTISSFDTCKTVKIKANQVNSQVLVKVFSFFPDSIFLISDSGNVVTASSQGSFEISVSNAREGWTCHGDSMKPPQPQLPIDHSKELQYCYQGRTHGRLRQRPQNGYLTTQLQKNSQSLEFFVMKQNGWRLLVNIRVMKLHNQHD